jgi:hypothetical protein
LRSITVLSVIAVMLLLVPNLIGLFLVWRYRLPGCVRAHAECRATHRPGRVRGCVRYAYVGVAITGTRAWFALDHVIGRALSGAAFARTDPAQWRDGR